MYRLNSWILSGWKQKKEALDLAKAPRSGPLCCPFLQISPFLMLRFISSSSSPASRCSSSEHHHCVHNGLRCTKTDLKTHRRRGGEGRERDSRGGSGCSGIFLLSFFAACPTDIQEETQRHGEYAHLIKTILLER